MKGSTFKYPHSICLAIGIVLIIGLDQWTKSIASGLLTYAQPVQVLPILDWTLLHNTGAAFSFLADAGGWQRWFFTIVSSIVSIGFFIWMIRLKPNEWITRYSLMFIIGGALGNLIDRINMGYVVDFIHFHWQAHYFPAFNIADMSISFGAILILLEMFIGNGSAKKQAANE